MKIALLLALGLLILGPLADSGRILRTWRRGHPGRRPGRMTPFRPPLLRRSHYSSPWTYFRRPRTIHQHQGVDGTGKRSQFNTHGFYKERERENSQHHHGFPIQRDPTTHYAPPTEDEINLGNIPGRRNLGGHVRKFRPWRRPPPPITHISLWKLLSMQRRRRYGPPRRPFPRQPPPPPPTRQRPYGVSSEEAEVAPVLPNFVYFLPKDILPASKKINSTATTPATIATETSDLKPGFVSDVPLYPTEATSASEFKPVTSRDYLMKVVEVRRPKPESTTASSDSTIRSAPAPDNLDLLDSTETLLDELLQEPPSPINSFNINIDPMAEGSDSFIKIAPSSFVETFRHPPTTVPSKSTTTSSTTTTTTTVPKTTTTTPTKMTTTAASTTFKPMFAVRVVMTPPNPTTTKETTKSSKEKKSEEKVLSSKEMKDTSGLVITNSKESKSGATSSKELKFITTTTTTTSSKESKVGGVTSKERTEVINKPSLVYNSKEKGVVVISAGKVEGGEELEDGEPTNQREEDEQKPTKAPPKPAPAYKWPTMKPYIKSIKKPTTQVSKVSSVVAKSSSSGTSSESTSISITGIRSRVKEYKPSVLPTSPGLLIFDKVDTSGEVTVTTGSQKGSTTSSTSSPPPEKPTTESETVNKSSSTTTVSPMQNFDPMKMIHSWLTKAKPS